VCTWTVTVSHAWVGVASCTAQAAVAEDSDRRCGAVLETVMQAQQALKKRLAAQIQTLEGEGGEMQKKHEAFAAEAKKFLQHLMDGVSGLTAWRESATAGAKVRLVLCCVSVSLCAGCCAVPPLPRLDGVPATVGPTDTPTYVPLARSLPLQEARERLESLKAQAAAAEQQRAAERLDDIAGRAADREAALAQVPRPPIHSLSRPLHIPI